MTRARYAICFTPVGTDGADLTSASSYAMRMVGDSGVAVSFRNRRWFFSRRGENKS